jgi:hypothetical protein
MLTPDQHLVVEMLSDPVGCTRSLRRMHDAVLRGKRPPGRVRSVVSNSWQRSMSANVDPDAVTAPIAYSNSDIVALRQNHPLSLAIATARQTLLDIADAAQHVVIVTDAHGVILWCDGASAIRAAAENVGLIEGAIITEDAIGTNAVGTALAIDRPTLIHSAEHLVRTFHTWTCSASPLHDPDTGEVLGVIDISGGVASAHPSSSVLLSTTAQLVEHQMRIAVIQRDAALRAANQKHLADLRGAGGALLSPTGRVLAAEGTDPLPERIPIATGRVPLGDGREGIIEPLAEGYLLRLARHPQLSPETALSLTVLGAAQPAATLNGHRVLLTDRHAEILTLLALHPAGLTSEQLTCHLYGDTGTVATARAEIHRLRAQLGSILATRPYRLRASVTADLLSVKAALRAGDVHRALAAYRGALLPRSESPTIRAERDELHSAVRRAAIDQGGGDELWLLAETDLGRDDLEVLDAAHRALPPQDPRRAIVAARANRVLTED